MAGPHPRSAGLRERPRALSAERAPRRGPLDLRLTAAQRFRRAAVRSVGRVCEHTFVRWDNLTITAEEQAALPGYREPAIVRHFDAPEALDTRFYEVRAKSALNRVPERSRMPFRWTINPYRGCSHSCTYCLGAETPILLADGRTRPLAQLSLGDQIVGTEICGRYRRYVTTE